MVDLIVTHVFLLMSIQTMPNAASFLDSSDFVLASISTSAFGEVISLSASNFFLTELMFRYPIMILPMFLILNNFKVDFASVALMSVTRGVAAGE